MVDWCLIRNEYVAGNISMRKLAEKYGVSFYTLRHHAAAEGWKACRDKAGVISVTKLVTGVAAEKAAVNSKFSGTAEYLLNMLDEIVRGSVDMDSATFRQYAAALKDLKAVLDIRSEADLREQEARIRKLEAEATAKQREAEHTDQSQTVTVVLADNVDELAK